MASLNDGIVKFAPIEELVECIFRLVIQISLEFTAEEELPRNHISFLALDWLYELWYRKYGRYIILFVLVNLPPLHVRYYKP